MLYGKCFDAIDGMQVKYFPLNGIKLSVFLFL